MRSAPSDVSTTVFHRHMDMTGVDPSGSLSSPRAAREVTFRTRRGGTDVPAVVWLPPDRHATAPLVLLGHGGSGHKRDERLTDLARQFAAAGVATLAIDGPYHGERVSSPLTPAEYQRLITERGMDQVLDSMVDDWTAALAAAVDLADLDVTEIGYVGMSMGARFGLALAAALGGALTCLVLGKFGLEANGIYPGLNVADRIRRDAQAVTVPTLLHVQWDDELFPRAGQLALFDALGARDKRLSAWPGPHRQTDPQAQATWVGFVLERFGIRSTPPR